MDRLRSLFILVAVAAGMVAAAVIGFALLGPILTSTEREASTLEAGRPSSTVTGVARLPAEQPPGATPSAMPEKTPTTVPALQPSDTPRLPPSPTPLPMPTPTATAPPIQVAEPSTPEATATEPVGVAPGIVVHPTSLSVSEGKGSATFALTLSTEPQAAVTITLSTSNERCSVSTEVVTLDVDNWRSGITVAVTARDDQVASGDQACLVETGSADSADADYGALQSDDVSVTVLDDDEAGILVAPTSLSVSEPEDAASFTVALSSEPLAEVTIPLRTSNEQCLLSSDSVTLDSTNWLTGAAVKVVASDDLVADGEQTCLVLTGAATSEGADYSGMDPEDVVVTVSDDDEAGILVAPTSLSVSEPGDSATITISLTCQPRAAVTLHLRTSNKQCSVSPGTVTLDSDNWRDGARVTVVAVNDWKADGERPCRVVLDATSSADAAYDGLLAEEVKVTVTDDDVPAIFVSPTSLSLTESEGPARITIGLRSQPRSPVSISLSPSNDECSLSRKTVTLDSTNWRTGLTVKVTVPDDQVAKGQRTSSIRLAVKSDDANYGGLEVPDVTAVIDDDDVAGVRVTPTDLILAEGTESVNYQVVLTSRPTGKVIIRVSSDDRTAVSPDVLTFGARKWNVPQTVTVTALDSGEPEMRLTRTITHTVGGKDASYSKLSIGDVVVRAAGAAREPEVGAGDRILEVEEGELSEAGGGASNSGPSSNDPRLLAALAIAGFVLLLGLLWLLGTLMNR